jgi:hypothetical protein
MIPGKLVAVLKKELVAEAQDKNAALLPEITVCTALAETFFHGLEALDQRCRAQRFPEATLEPESPVCAEVLVYIHFAGKMELQGKMPRTPGAAASNSDQGDSVLIEFSFDVHEGSRLLPCKHSAEMAEKGKHDAPALPQRLEYHFFFLERLDSYTGDSGLQLIIGHFSLLCMHGEWGVGIAGTSGFFPIIDSRSHLFHVP